MIKFSYLDVKSIHSDVPRSQFSEAEIDRLADLILECEGVLKPIFVQQINLEHYKVIQGDLEYYGAVRAKEKNLRKGELINAIIVSADQEQSIKQQLDFFKKAEPANIPEEKESSVSQTNLEPRVMNLELRLEKAMNDIREEMKNEKRKTEERFKAIEGEQKKQITPLEVLNTYEKDKLFQSLQRKRVKNADKLADAICKVRANKKEGFTDMTDVFDSVKSLNIKGLLGQKTMLSIIDALSSL
ncbi:MAG: chromosome partitioning protein ParB [Cyanobacteriota bacterium]|nr:chromosome partitioning protein ParB [Cyanobacteriota bacterium]